MIAICLIHISINVLLHFQEVAGVGISILETVLMFNPSDATLVLCHIKMLEGGLQNFVVYNEQMFLQKYLEKVSK